MAERPFLIFPQATVEVRRNLGGGGGQISRPTAAQQRERLDAKFQQIASSFQHVQTTVQGIEPEQVVVFETVGDSIHGLAEAASKIEGMEWLAEMDLDDIGPGDGFADEEDSTKSLTRRLYAVMSNQKAITELLALWGKWCSQPDKQAKRGFGPFKNIFIHLKDVRRWSVEDRLFETRVIEYWSEGLDGRTEPIQFEVELWCRGHDGRRQQAYANLQTLVQQAGGQCLRSATVQEILYHGVMVEMPVSAMRKALPRILDKTYTQWLRCEEVMFFRPLGQARFPSTEKQGELPSLRQRMTDRPAPAGDAVVALLDGLPLENHVALAGRLRIDDPDNLSAQYQAEQQEHGTAMASLIVHGDLNDNVPV